MSLCPWDPAGQQAALRWERGVGPREIRGDVQHHVPKGTRLRATCRSTGRTPAERRAGRCSSSGQGCVRPKGQEGSEGCPEPKATCTTPGRDSRYSACREGRRAVSRAVILKPNQIPAPCGAVPLRRPQGAAGASPPLVPGGCPSTLDTHRPSPTTGGRGCPGTGVGSGGPSPAKPRAPEGTAAPNNTASVCPGHNNCTVPALHIYDTSTKNGFSMGEHKRAVCGAEAGAAPLLPDPAWFQLLRGEAHPCPKATAAPREHDATAEGTARRAASRWWWHSLGSCCPLLLLPEPRPAAPFVCRGADKPDQ